jgi:hypothetical protein
MWSKPRPAVKARMPSTRAQPLNPRAVPARALKPAGTPAPAPPETPAEARDRAKRAGGFHESSYELQQGLEVTESEWSDDIDITTPGDLNPP